MTEHGISFIGCCLRFVFAMYIKCLLVSRLLCIPEFFPLFLGIQWISSSLLVVEVRRCLLRRDKWVTWGDHSPVIVKFTDFSRYFPHKYQYSLNHQRYTDRLRVLLSEYCGTICSPSCACQLYLTVLRLCLFCDYHNCGSAPQANYNFLDFSLTNVEFPDFSRWVVTLGIGADCPRKIWTW